MKKHGCLWWLFIGWWWWVYALPFRIIKAFFRWAGTADRAEKRKELEAKRDAILRARQERNLGNAEPSGSKRAEESGPKKEEYKVAGVSYRQDAIQSLGIKNPDFLKTRQDAQDAGLLDKWIYEYKFKPQNVELQPEPDNPYSENGDAVKVVVDGVHIGYIASESSTHVHDLISSNKIQRVTCFITGGRKKRYHRDSEEEGEYNLERDDFLFYARVTVITK